MNRKIPTAIAIGAFLIAATMAYGFQAGTAVSESFGVQGWVQVSHVRDGQVLSFQESHNVITTTGVDVIAEQIGSTSPSTNGANYIALTNNTAAASSASTSLTGEISTGGLARAIGAFAHTNGTSTYTVSKTFTASATNTGVQKAGLFTSSAGNAMFAENTFSSVNLISGDQLTITWTITIS